MLRLRLLAGLILPGLLCACTQPVPVVPPVMEIGHETQVLVDDFILERTEALERRLNPLVKHAANPLLRPQERWEGQFTLPTSVLFDDSDQRFKMWYLCRDGLSSPRRGPDRWAYAVSSDGITWEKPDLGLTSFAGSVRNNLIPYPVSRVLLDPNDVDSGRRFKALGHGRVEEKGLAGLLVGFSPTAFGGAFSRRVPSSPGPGARGLTTELGTLILCWAGMSDGTGMWPSCGPATDSRISGSHTAPTSSTGGSLLRC